MWVNTQVRNVQRDKRRGGRMQWWKDDTQVGDATGWWGQGLGGRRGQGKVRRGKLGDVRDEESPGGGGMEVCVWLGSRGRPGTRHASTNNA